ncbi:MAG: threonine/serine exporter family protein [Gaiella sp.]|nr:threonine/serine exporter family protein [Gaiella sp.]
MPAAGPAAPGGPRAAAAGSDDRSRHELLSFLASLGAALGAIGETVGAVQLRLADVARAYGLPDARFSVLPTSILLTLGRGGAATIEPTTRLSPTPRLDQISAVHGLAEEAERGLVTPAEGLTRLEAIRELGPRFGTAASILGYATLTVGIALVLHPAARDVAAAGALGVLVGVLRRLALGRQALETLMPFFAAFAVAAVTALLVEHDVTDPGLRAMIASLVVFIPGVPLTTAFVELTEGEMIAGSSRLVWGAAQLGLLAFGIVAGIGAVGVPPEKAFSSSDALLGWWAPWLGVLVFAAGVAIANSAPPGAFASLLVVLYAAWAGQVVGNWLFGSWVSGFVGAVVMTLTAYVVARLPSTMPVYATFLPGFWLLVPGSLGLIGLTSLVAGSTTAAATDILAIVGSIAAVALGVLVGVELFRWLTGAERRARRLRRRRV